MNNHVHLLIKTENIAMVSQKPVAPEDKGQEK